MSRDNLTSWRSGMLRNPHLLVLVLVIVIVAGLSALSNLPRLEDPRITTRNAIIITPYPGASAERVEILVSDVIEDELLEMFEIKEVRSTSRAGISLVSLELEAWVTSENNETIFSKIRDRLSDAESRLPQGASKPFFDDKRGAAAYTLITSLTPQPNSDISLTMLSRFADELADDLRVSMGTELVRIYGEKDEEVVVSIHPKQLISTGLSPQQVAQSIAASDSKSTAGLYQDGSQELQMSVKGELLSMDQIGDLPLQSNRQGNYLRVKDIADVYKGAKEPDNEVALIDSTRGIFVAARMDKTMRVDRWTDNAQAIIKTFSERHQYSFTTEIIYEQNQYTESRLKDLTGNLLMGSLVVVLVVLVFMGLRAALIVGLALPLSSASTLFGLTFFGEQIHQMTIFGIIIAIGLLIDNAIVMTDEVRKQLSKDSHRVRALEQSVKQLFIPLSASTITTVLGFMPIFLLPGNVGDFVGPIAISVVLALLSSLFLSFTVIAVLAARFTPLPETIKLKENDNNYLSWLQQGVQTPQLAQCYGEVLKKALLHPWITLSLVLVLPLSGFVLSKQLGNVFFPSADRDQFEIHVYLPEQTHIDETQQVVKDIEQLMKEYPAIQQTTWLVGGSNPSVYYNQIMNKDNLSSYAHGIVTIDDVKKVPYVVDKMQRKIDENITAAKVIIKMFGQGPPVSAPISLELTGDNLEQLAVLGESLRFELENHPKVSHSMSSLSIGEPEMTLDVDIHAANLLALSRGEISEQLNALTVGVTGGTVIEGNTELPVRVKVDNALANDFSQIRSLPLISPVTRETGQWTSPQVLGDLTLEPKVRSITHFNGDRVNLVEAFLRPGAKAIDVTNQVVDAWLEKQGSLPLGISLMVAGESNEQDEATGLLAQYLPVLGVLMITCLVLSFNSVTISGIIALVAFLSVGLGLLSLWISGLPIGFNPLLGLAGLIGVAINGSIVIIAAIMANSTAKSGDKAAIVYETLHCCRHIISTTITTIGGFIPLLLSSGGTFWPPLAVVIAGGVGFSIVLSLVFTPVTLSLVLPKLYKKTAQSHTQEKTNYHLQTQ